jgi:large subunit ribosomal protein L14
MITKGSSLKVIDNSGAKWSKCIKVIGKSLIGSTGDLILVSLTNFKNRKKVKKRTIYLGLIAGTRKWILRLDGSCFRFFVNKVLLFTRQFKFLGTRVYGAISKEVKFKINIHTEKKHLHKVFSYTSLII